MKKLIKSINSNILKIRRKLLQISYLYVKNYSWFFRVIFFAGNTSKETNLQIKKLKKKFESTKEENMFIGPFLGFDKGVIGLLNSIKNSGYKNFTILSSAPPLKLNFKAESLQDFIIQLPEIFEKENFHAFPGLKGIKNKNHINAIKNNYEEELSLLMKLYPFAKQKHCIEYVFFADQIASLIHSNKSIKKIFIWNSYIVLHKIIAKKCNNKEIVYLEFGQIPNTLSVDDNGQLNNSSLNSRDFLSKYDDAILRKKIIDDTALKSLKKLKETGDNRNNPRRNISKLRKLKFDNLSPIIFLAGQNDLESGIYENSPDLKELSPVFQSSFDAFKFLSKLSDAIGFNLIYKPHPNSFNREIKNIKNLAYSKRVQVTNYENINDLIDISSITVTIVSSVSFISLIREKPTILLGNNELTNKNICFECKSKLELETDLKSYLQNENVFKQKHLVKQKNWLLFYEKMLESRYLINVSKFNNNYKKDYDSLGMSIMNFLNTYL